MIFLPLSSLHDRNSFDCGNDDLNRWFAQVARQHKEKGISSTFVAVENSLSTEVLGYYAIAVTELVNAELPEHLRKRLPIKVPAFRLGRLAVSVRHQRQKVGESLLMDAIDRVARISRDVGGVGVVVDAKPTAIEFYKRYGFEQMADHPLNLFLSL